jgi:hypothetical protein
MSIEIHCYNPPGQDGRSIGDTDAQGNIIPSPSDTESDQPLITEQQLAIIAGVIAPIQDQHEPMIK